MSDLKNHNDTKLYTSSEFAKLVGVSLNTIRNWDKNNIISPAVRKNNGWRRYTEEQVKQCQEIKPKTVIIKNTNKDLMDIEMNNIEIKNKKIRDNKGALT